MLRLLVALVALLAFLVPAAQPTAAQSLTKMTVVTSPSDSGGQVYYAQAQGIFKKYGLDVEIISVSSGAAVTAAMSSGRYDVGQGNIATIATAHEKGLPFVLVAGASIYNAKLPSSALVVPKDSPIKSAADLVGKNVSNPGARDIGTVALDAWLQQQGVAPEKVHVVEMASAQMNDALARGVIDAAILIEPFLNQGLSGPNRILGLHYSAIAPRFMIAAYFASSDWVRAHPEAARAFNAAMVESARWANANHAKSAQILAEYTKVQVTPTQTRAEYADSLDPSLIQPLIDAAIKDHMMKGPLAAKEIIAPL
jgi:NitT/TauT family transport system substrate-binding protein